MVNCDVLKSTFFRSWTERKQMIGIFRYSDQEDDGFIKILIFEKKG